MKSRKADKKVTKLMAPGLQFYYAVMLIFVGVTFYLGRFWLGIAELAAAVLLIAVHIKLTKDNRRRIEKYFETLSINSELLGGNFLSTIEVPMVFVRSDSGELFWANPSFIRLSDCPRSYYGYSLEELLPGFEYEWVRKGSPEAPDFLRVGDRSFRVFCSFLSSDSSKKGALFAALYFVENTRELFLAGVLEESRPFFAEIICDSYEDMGKLGAEAVRASLMAGLEGELNEWLAGTNTLIRSVDRDKYILLGDERAYRQLAGRRFEILERVRKLTAPNGLPLTVSIGVGREGESIPELGRQARLALDMALSRGGDQAVVRSSSNFEFFGGLTKEPEKRTKVRSRLMANVFKGLVADASSVYVMGHRIADLDSLGAAAGVVAAARALGKKSYIVIDRSLTNAQELIELLESHPAYSGVLIPPSQAMLNLDGGSLLVIVDTNRASYVEDEALLESANRVVVIDHHRRVADYIEDADLSIHEPAASSVCEILAEMLQYLAGPEDILGVEASALLSGIVLDTKSFSLKTGSRTFEAAAFLRRSGADSQDVKKLFQSDLENYVRRAELVKNAEFFEGSYALSVSGTPVDRAVAAQAADDLMNISGVGCSFVIYPFEDTVSISARSLGRVNVQLIMEKLGGGGHFTTAGTQIRGKTAQEVKSMLRDAITVYNFEQ